jgi:hypothetical protein
MNLTPEPTPTVANGQRDKREFAEEVLQKFIGATSFTLKRVMAEELLKKMDELKDSPMDLAQWYATTVIRASESKLDFGLKQRNVKDFDFHHDFAKRVPMDRLKWEVLNRYHRIFNHLN